MPPLGQFTKKCCTKCLKPLPRSAFPLDKRRPNAVGPWCYDCISKAERERYHKDIIYSRMRVRERRKKYRRQFTRHNWVCANCGAVYGEPHEHCISAGK